MLKIEQIEKAFGTHAVLKGVSFSVKEGEIYGLIGKNGAGKTTLMNIMAGLSSTDKGTCTINGDKICPGSNVLKVGYLPDLPAFYEYLTTGEFLDFLLMSGDRKRREELLELVDLAEDIKILTMSRGMRQRLGIAAAIVNNPDVILLDEPTSALDPSGRADVMRILKELKGKGKSVVLSTHILADMERVCDRVGFLTEGCIKYSLAVSELAEGCDYIRVSFENSDIDETLLKQANLRYTIVENGIYRFELDSTKPIEAQKHVLGTLAILDYRIASIRNESNNLDKLFQEVCG